VYSALKNAGEMAAFFKKRVEIDKPLARLYFNNSGPHAGWYVWYRLKRESRPARRIALCASTRNDVEEALAEAADFLGCPPDRIQVDSR